MGCNLIQSPPNSSETLLIFLCGVIGPNYFGYIRPGNKGVKKPALG